MSATGTFTVRIPMQIRKRGGRKLILAPDGGGPIWAAPRPRVDNTIIKAVARAFRWRKLIETGVHASIEDVARAEKINSTYVGRVLRLTLLAPEIIEAIMDGRQPAGMTMAGLLTGFPVVWAEQRAVSGGSRMGFAKALIPMRVLQEGLAPNPILVPSNAGFALQRTRLDRGGAVDHIL